MEFQRIEEDDVFADAFVRERLLVRLLGFPEVRKRVVPSDNDRPLYELLMDAAEALKTYHPSYVSIDVLLEEVAQSAARLYPRAAKRAVRAARHLLNAA